MKVFPKKILFGAIWVVCANLYSAGIQKATIAKPGNGSAAGAQFTFSGIRFVPREDVFYQQIIPGLADLAPTIGPGYKVGVFTTGKYKGYDLIWAAFVPGGSTEETSQNILYDLRFAKKGRDYIFLPRISDIADPAVNPAKSSNILPDVFKKMDTVFHIDKDFTVPFLENPVKISSSHSRQTLSLKGKGEGIVKPTQFQTVFKSDIFGPIVRLKDENSAGFTVDDFFIFRPDGTYVILTYVPDFSTRDIQWKTPSKKGGEKEFVLSALFIPDEPAKEIPSVVPNRYLLDKDLEAVGQNRWGDSIFELKDGSHPILLEFFHLYEDAEKDETMAGEFSSWENKSDNEEPLMSYSEFLAAHPVLFWRDPFGRMLRFNNKKFIPSN